MAEARYAIVENDTNLVVNCLVIDKDNQPPTPIIAGTYEVEITEATGEPTTAGTYDPSSKVFVVPKYLQGLPE